MWQVRGGERWLLEGDASTAFFHGVANKRKTKCLIRSLEDNGEIVTEVGKLKDLITSFYKNLFGSKRQSNVRLHSDIWKQNSKITIKENEELKVFWNEIKDILLEMFQDLRTGHPDLFRLNYGILTLIPKVKGANNIKQFRPISLLNVVYKIITKVLTLRLNRVADKIICPNQSAFVLGRFILDGVVVIHEVLHELARKKQSGIILKLDFEKAYDKVSWRFLEEVTKSKGFSDQWIDWVMKAVRGGRVAVNLNGELGQYFRSYKGLRQGDPLSPTLFNLDADGLTTILNKAVERGVLSGVTPHLVPGGLTHL